MWKRNKENQRIALEFYHNQKKKEKKEQMIIFQVLKNVYWHFFPLIFNFSFIVITYSYYKKN